MGSLLLALAYFLDRSAAPFWLVGVLGLYLVVIGLLDVVWCASSWFRGTAAGRAFDRRILLVADRLIYIEPGDPTRYGCGLRERTITLCTE